MLVSVKNIAEARIAASTEGITIVDVKAPSQGSLGFAGAATVNAIADCVEEICQTLPNTAPPDSPDVAKKSISVALGELHDLNPIEISQINWAKIHFAKIGLSGAYQDQQWRRPLAKAISVMPPDVARVLVVYVDQVNASSGNELLRAAAEDGLSVVLLDTFNKSQGNVFAHWNKFDCKRLFQSASALAMTTVLAGSIDVTDLESAHQTTADLIGVRGAVCAGDRATDLSPRRLAEFLQAFGNTARTPPLVQRSDC